MPAIDCGAGGLVVEPVAEREDVAEHERGRVGEALRTGGGRSCGRSSSARIAAFTSGSCELDEELVEAQRVLEAAVGRPPHEAVVAGHAEQHAAGRAPTCGMSSAPSALAAAHGVELLAPEVGGAHALQHEERHGQAGGLRAGHPVDLAEGHGGVVAGLAHGHDLEQAAAGVDHRRASPISSSAAAKVPGTGSPSRSLWFSDAGGREADGAGLDGLRTRRPSRRCRSAVASSLRAPRSPMT